MSYFQVLKHKLLCDPVIEQLQHKKEAGILIVLLDLYIFCRYWND